MIETIEWPHLSGLSDEAASLIRDLSLRENIRLPVIFEKEPPLILLCGKLDSKPNAGGKYRHQKNDPKYADMKKLLEHLTAEANEGNPASMYQLAIFHRNGLGDTPRDSAKEYYWLQKLLGVDDESDEVKKYKAHALWYISSMYYNGEVPGEKQSFVKSYRYKEMASQLCPNDFPSNALMKSWGVGVEFDYEDILIVKAIEYGEKVARSGLIDAMVDLIRIYQYEECQNYERACYHAVKASEGDRGAALHAGYFFLFICGCEPNLTEAKKYFRMVCDVHMHLKLNTC